MEIKKVKGGWEYNGIVCSNKADLEDAIRAEKENPTPKALLPELKLVWHPEMGTDCLEYEIAQYLAKPGNNIKTLTDLISGKNRETA